MVRIFHISDLHIIEGAEWNNMRAALLNEVQEKVAALQDGEKMVVITGDFHNFSDNTYRQAGEFLKELFEIMNIDPSQDVFVVPGNHDVANEQMMSKLYSSDTSWRRRRKSALSELKNGDNDYIACK